MQHPVFWIVPAASLVSLAFAAWFFRSMVACSEGTPLMKEIASHVRVGAMAYLKQQYKVVGMVFAIMSITGLSMAARAHRVTERAEAEKILRLLPAKYPDAPPTATPGRWPTHSSSCCRWRKR